jgi:DNA mismatch repair protein MutL
MERDREKLPTRGKVQILPQEIIHRIAAGEVVDRPASVLKELLDNSIDSGATRIRVLLIDGGLKSLEIEDDGCGMSRDDLELCTVRHATSKIQNIEDLEAIRSLGFRGEALAAVSSVSHLKIESVQVGNSAWLLSNKGGMNQTLTPSSRAIGTRVVVDDLFFNVPARKKFLKSLGAELNECVETLTSVALAHPEIAFEWHALDSQSGEIKKHATWLSGSLVERFESVYGNRSEILYFLQEPSLPEIKLVEVACYRPPVHSAFQKTVRLSVNGRPVSDKRLPYALREAFGGLIEVGRYPIFQANLTVDVTSVDVNIHPQKKEIRWPQNFSLGSFLYSLVRPQFEIAAPVEIAPEYQAPLFTLAPVSSANNDSDFRPSAPVVEFPRADARFVNELHSVHQPTALNLASAPAPDFSFTPKIASSNRPTSTEGQPAFRFSELRVIGEAGAAWIVCESQQGILLIDQHAAHERVNYERILRQKNLLRSKPLLFPIELPESISWEGILAEFKAALLELSFELSDDGKSIIAVPEADRKINWEQWLKEILEELRSSQDNVGRIQTLPFPVTAASAADSVSASMKSNPF